MTQTVPATAVLGPGKTGLTIGLRVLNLDGTTYAAFATTGVAETSTAGTYRKANGVVVPAAGGHIVWGTALVDYAEATVDAVPSVPSASDNATAVAAAILATPANKLAVDANGYAAANVTEQSKNEIVDAVWNEVMADHLGPTSTGGHLDLASQAGPVGNMIESVGYQRFKATALENVRPAVGLATANLDTQLAGIGSDVADLLSVAGALPTDQDINDILAAGTVNSVAEGVSLATEAINVNTFDTSALQAIADAMGLAPTETPAAGSLLASVAGIEEDTGVTLPATLDGLPAAVDSKLSGSHGAGAWGGAGAWPKPFVYTLTSTATGQTIAGALIEVYADIGMTALVDQGVTDAYGRVRFELPPGTYYFKRAKTGWTFVNPDTEVQA